MNYFKEMIKPMAFANFKEENHEERWKKRETKMYDEIFEDPERDHIIDSLLKFFDQLPQPKVKVVDFERFNTMIQSALNLKKCLLRQNHKVNWKLKSARS